MYIRRGDKHVEAKPVPVQEYINALALLSISDKYAHDGHNTNNNVSQSIAIFLGTEDSGVIAEMCAWAAGLHKHGKSYELFITEVFNRKGLFAERNAAARRKPTASTPDHHPEEYLSMLLNVQYLVRGTAYICTLSSNFCRIIDELRATVGAKADHTFVDLSKETCGQPPCMGSNLVSLDWRWRV